MTTTYLQGNDVSPFVLFGTVIGVSAPICVRNINYCLRHRSQWHKVKILKSAMAFFMLLKSCLVVAQEVPNGASCKALGRFGDVFYQFSVTLGDAVVLERITEVVPWQLRARIGHCIAILIRLIIGMVDVPLASVYLSFEGGPCVYRDQPVVGALYTSLDTAISLYATIMTFLVLTWELRKREQEGSIPVHRYHYITIVTRYTAPVFCLTVVNMIGTIGNGSSVHNLYYVPLVETVWPIVNLLFVALIGYDIDLCKVIRAMHTQDKQTTVYDEALAPDLLYTPSPL